MLLQHVQALFNNKSYLLAATTFDYADSKGNSTAIAVQVDINMQEQLA